MQGLLWKVLLDNGIDQADSEIVYVLNGEQPEGAYDKPSAAQLARTRTPFRDAMRRANATCILAFGGDAFNALTGLKWGIDDARGYIIYPRDCKQRLERRLFLEGVFKSGPRKGQAKEKWRPVPVPPPLPEAWDNETDDHRAFIVACPNIGTIIKQQSKTISGFTTAVEAAVEYARGAARMDEDFSYTEYLPTCFEPAPHDALAFDVETPMDSRMIDRFSTSMMGFGIRSPHQREPVTHTLPWNADTKRFLQDAINSARVRIAHNIQFDVGVLTSHGITVPEPWFDTMLATQLIEPELPKGLGRCATLYHLCQPWKHVSAEKGHSDPFYSAKDAFMEMMIYQKQRVILKEFGMLDLFERRMMPSVPVLIDLHEKGLRVDKAFCIEWCAGLEKQLHALMVQWRATVGTVDPAKNAQVRELLYKTWRLPVQRTKGDGTTVDETAIRTLIDLGTQHTAALELLLEIRGISKMISTYASTALGRGYVHPSYIPRSKDDDNALKGAKGGAATGRLAASNPNIQNQPKAARRLYLPDEGNEFVSMDQSQAEMRYMAAVSGDQALLAALETDVHSYTMKIIGCDRTRAKNGIYGTAYGAGPKGLVNMFAKNGVRTTIKEMKAFQDGLQRAYPDWWAWRERVGTLAVQQGYLRNPFGRLRRFTAQQYTSALDFLPQSAVADIGYTLYRPVHDMLQSYGGRVSALVHDEILMQVPKQHVHVAARAARAIAEQEFPEVAPGFKVPVTLSHSSRSWGEMKPLEV